MTLVVGVKASGVGVPFRFSAAKVILRNGKLGVTRGFRVDGLPRGESKSCCGGLTGVGGEGHKSP